MGRTQSNNRCETTTQSEGFDESSEYYEQRRLILSLERRDRTPGIKQATSSSQAVASHWPCHASAMLWVGAWLGEQGALVPPWVVLT